MKIPAAWDQTLELVSVSEFLKTLIISSIGPLCDAGNLGQKPIYLGSAPKNLYDKIKKFSSIPAFFRIFEEKVHV